MISRRTQIFNLPQPQQATWLPIALSPLAISHNCRVHDKPYRAPNTATPAPAPCPASSLLDICVSCVGLVPYLVFGLVWRDNPQELINKPLTNKLERSPMQHCSRQGGPYRCHTPEQASQQATLEGGRVALTSRWLSANSDQNKWQAPFGYSGTSVNEDLQRGRKMQREREGEREWVQCVCAACSCLITDRTAAINSLSDRRSWTYAAHIHMYMYLYVCLICI